MDLTFRTIGAWGAGKGSNLAPVEVDNNFWELAQAIFDLQADPAIPVGIASITVSGTQMTIHLTDGTVLGPYTLPVLTMRWRGDWQPSTIYDVLDVVSDAATGIYMVQIAHTSGTVFDPALLIGGLPAFLMLFGIDIAGSPAAVADEFMMSNITGGPAIPIGNSPSAYLDYVFGDDRGSLLFRGAAAWTVLFPGTAGQILSTGGPAADVSWIPAPTGGSGGTGLDTTGSFTAAGTAQGTAQVITAIQNYVVGATGTNGVVFDVSLMVAGAHLYVANENITNTLLLYPAVGARFNNLAVNAPMNIYPDTTSFFVVKSATQIRSVP